MGDAARAAQEGAVACAGTFAGCAGSTPRQRRTGVASGVAVVLSVTIYIKFGIV